MLFDLGGSKEIKLGEQHDFIFDVDIYENQLVLTTRNGKQNSVAIYDLEFVATTDVWDIGLIWEDWSSVSTWIAGSFHLECCAIMFYKRTNNTRLLPKIAS